MPDNNRVLREDASRDLSLDGRFSSIAGARLPEWDEIPNLELYMDQVISYVAAMLKPFMPADDGRIVTASMVNNYVKKDVLPAPVKKRYRRLHIAYLLMILIAKSELQLREIRLLLERVRDDLRKQEASPVSDPEADAARLYGVFLAMYSRARQAVFAELPADETDSLVPEETASVRALYWICLTSCARLRSILQVQDLTASPAENEK